MINYSITQLLLHFTLLLFFNCFAITAQTTDTNKSKTIGIAFGGGGAKGLAHIGVIKVLEENGIRPDYVAGTSMGSIIGGLYAIGYSVEDLITLSKNTDWNDYFQDNISRDLLAIEEKSDEERYLLNFPVDIRKRKIELPRGIINGEKMSLLLARLMAPVHQIENFDDFAIPFRCVATDLETGKAVVFDNGYLPDAIRASAAIPSVFEPIECNGKWLVDGGVVRNLPVQDVKDMGADITIAIDVGSGLARKEELTSLLGIMAQTSSYQVVSSSEEQRKLADVLILPKIEQFGMFSFEAVDSLVAIGEAAARAKLPDILKLLEGADRPITPIETMKSGLQLQERYHIVDIVIEGLKKQSPKFVRSLLRMNTPKIMSLDRIERAMKRLYSTKFFQKIDYRILPVDKGYRLQVQAQEKSSDLFRLGFRYDNDLNAGILLNFTLRNKLINGSRFLLEGRLAERPALLMNYLVYTKWRPSIGLKISGMLDSYPAYLYDENKELDREKVYQHGVIRADLFSGITNNTYLSAGIGMETMRQNNAFFSIKDDNIRLQQSNVYIELNHDTRNTELFPTAGSRLLLQSKLILNGNIQKIEPASKRTINFTPSVWGRYRQVFPLSKRWAMQWYNAGGWLSYDESNPFDLFYLGRALPNETHFFQFMGLNYMQQPASIFAFSGLSLQWEIWNNMFAAFNVNGGYAELKASLPETVSEDIGAFTANKNGLLGLGLRLGANTPIGPILFTSEYNLLDNHFAFSFRLGSFF